jgi:MinD-like ATPase involved in chromosome partitioning or flagellar assembly
MLVACWSVKGGSGTTVVTAALGLALASQGPGALLVDLAGDLPAALGVVEPDGPGLAGWLCAGADVPSDALGRLEVEVGPGLGLLPSGGPLPPAAARAEELAALLASDSRVVVADCGSAPSETTLALAAGAGLSLLVLRPCYLALRRALTAPLEASAIVLVGEPQRALQRADVEDVLGVRVRAAVPWRPAVATAVDAGLLGRRLPSPLERALKPLVDLVAAA